MITKLSNSALSGSGDFWDGLTNFSLNLTTGANEIAKSLTPATVTKTEVPSWLVPAGIGVAALVLVLVLSRK